MSGLSSRDKLATFRRRKGASINAPMGEPSGWPSVQPPSLPQRLLPLTHDEVELSTDSDHDGPRLTIEEVTDGPGGCVLDEDAPVILIHQEEPHGADISKYSDFQESARDNRKGTDEGFAVPEQGHANTLSLATIYLCQKEQVARFSIASEEQSCFVMGVLSPLIMSYERNLKLAASEISVLRERLVTVRQRVHSEGARRAALQRELGCVGEQDGASSSCATDKTLVAILQQQLRDQQLRHDRELQRAEQRRERERIILQDGFTSQLACLDSQIRFLKASCDNDERSASRIRDDISAMQRDLPGLPASPSGKVGQSVKSKVLQQRRDQFRLSQTTGSPCPETTLRVPHKGAAHRSPSRGMQCPSFNPRHGTVVASMGGSSWRSIYLVVTPQGDCCFSESMAEESFFLFSLRDVVAVRQGNSRHPQRPLLLSVGYGVGQQLDIALGDKSEREFWRQSFKVRRVQVPLEAAQPEHEKTSKFIDVCGARAGDSAASTPSLSSANPMLCEGDNPTLNKWLESQADNVRRGNLDPDNSSLNNNETNTPDADDGRATETGSDLGRKRPYFSSSPAPSRPPLGASVAREFVTTMSTSSRDRLPPLAPLQKRRSTISGSASTADSLTEEEIADISSGTGALRSAEEPIVPVSPSHTSDDGSSCPSDESINLSPELSPVAANAVTHEGDPGEVN